MENEEHSEKVKFGIAWGNFKLGYDGPGKVLWGVLLVLAFAWYCIEKGVFPMPKLFGLIAVLAFITGYTIVQKKF